MLLDPNSPILRQVPTAFFSPFPSEDALLDAKLQAILGAEASGGTTVGAELLTKLGGQAWNGFSQLLWKTKLTVVGDVTEALFRQIASFASDGSVRGIVAEVPFLLSADPARQLEALSRVGMDLALRAASAVPVAGWIVGLVVAIAKVVAAIWNANLPAEEKARRLPWQGYTQGSDEYLTSAIILNTYVPTLDWTPIFAPPTDLVPWRGAEGVNSDGATLGTIFAPVAPDAQGSLRDKVAWSSGVGVLPGTFRLAGIVQSMRVPQPADSLLRYYASGQLIRVGDRVTQTGDFYPLTSQAGGQLWQQARRFGSPDAFKIDAAQLLTAWGDWFSALYESALGQGFGDLLLPYLAYQVGKEWVIGVDAAGVLRPESDQGLVPLITPQIWQQGLATPATRTPCLFQETGKQPYEQLTFPTKFNRDGGGVLAAPPPPAPVRGRRCVPWPPGELLLRKYCRVDDAIVLPELQALKQLQRSSLWRSLVSAYVRPLDGPAGAAGAAFRDASLRDACIEARKALLAHPARHGVDLPTALIVDPEFGAALRDSGVSDKPVLRAPPPSILDPKAPAPPDPGPPQGGIPHEGRPARIARPSTTKSGGGFGPVLVGGAAAMTAIVAGLALRRSHA